MRLFYAAVAASIFGTAAVGDVLEFEGRVLPSERGIITSKIDGVVEAVFYENGAHVKEGDPLIQLDDTDSALALEMAKARLQQAEATLAVSNAQANRQRELLSRGLTSEASADPILANQKIAQADVELARAEVTAAEIGLERTFIRSPITGLVSNATAEKGMFVEAEANQGLGQVIVIDPVLVAYEVDYDTRLNTMAQADAASLDTLFERLSVAISLTNGIVVQDRLSPERASLELNDNGTLTVFLRVPNPDQLLRPGLTVPVSSTLLPSGVQN